jgi:hypothetical protein
MNDGQAHMSHCIIGSVCSASLYDQANEQRHLQNSSHSLPFNNHRHPPAHPSPTRPSDMTPVAIAGHLWLR